ncbi:MAG: Gifsy-2 prophage protein [uncultured Thermomicrobiales bacterium]|uniref:Abasic site processing protein n=1 Tax=uncultured Thermomicrobiales bacterium TaxID=1645740 RepID=A0A6J4VZ18_9BACT|nr:MAG: Gifsy-2 prophage protein [uncultured Thermomicrobiales bacterium]
MCGRFTLRNAEQLPLRFEATAAPEIQAALAPHYNIAPTLPIPIVVERQPGERQIELANWGLTPRRTTGKGFLAFNARAETLTERPLFRGLLPKSRCLIPGDGFIEWAKAGKERDPFYFGLDGGGLFAFAGLLDRWIDADGQPHAACAIITTAPNDLVGRIHDRMPVILPRADEASWLDPQVTAPGELLPLLAPYPGGAMTTWPLSRAINSSRTDAPELLQPIG